MLFNLTNFSIVLTDDCILLSQILIDLGYLSYSWFMGIILGLGDTVAQMVAERG